MDSRAGRKPIGPVALPAPGGRAGARSSVTHDSVVVT